MLETQSILTVNFFARKKYKLQINIIQTRENNMYDGEDLFVCIHNALIVLGPYLKSLSIIPSLAFPNISSWYTNR